VKNPGVFLSTTIPSPSLRRLSGATSSSKLTIPVKTGVDGARMSVKAPKVIEAARMEMMVRTIVLRE
jgi:hypothetical protein